MSGSMIGGVEHLELVDPLTGTGYESESQTLGRLGLMHGPLGEDLNTYSELAAYDRNLAQDADALRPRRRRGVSCSRPIARRPLPPAANRNHTALSPTLVAALVRLGYVSSAVGVTHSYPEHPVTVAQAQAAAVDAARRAAEAESRSAAALARAGLAPDGKDLPSSLLFPPIRPGELHATGHGAVSAAEVNAAIEGARRTPHDHGLSPADIDDAIHGARLRAASSSAPAPYSAALSAQIASEPVTSRLSDTATLSAQLAADSAALNLAMAESRAELSKDLPSSLRVAGGIEVPPTTHPAFAGASSALGLGPDAVGHKVWVRT